MMRLYPIILGLIFLLSCIITKETPILEGQDIRLTILHTSDIHGRSLPYDMIPMATDQGLGLLEGNGPYGGFARLGYLIKRERARSGRVIYVDSGDPFQGAPIFNAFLGEVELRALSTLMIDAMALGNHEFDEGTTNLLKQIQGNVTFPILAANYLFVDPELPGNPQLGRYVNPYTIVNRDGLKIALIGIGSFSSIIGITDIPNSMGVIPLENRYVLQDYIDFLSPLVDVIIGVSHAGLTEDELIIKQTTGFDIIMGGHLHIVTYPPKVIYDCQDLEVKQTHGCSSRPVILVHSGAFAKYLGRLDVVIRQGEVIGHKYALFPVDKNVPEDPEMVRLLEPYILRLNQMIDLTSIFGYAKQTISRFGMAGGDSELGNFVSESLRTYARSDFAFTNTLGIRTDINKGVINLDQLYNIFPFNNTITTLYMSGMDIQALLDYNTERSFGRGCATQIQVSGLKFTMDCSAVPPVAKDIKLTKCVNPIINAEKNVDPEEAAKWAAECEVPVIPTEVYQAATNDYIARGGSGFTMLRINNTQVDTGVSLRDGVLEKILTSPKCIESCYDSSGVINVRTCTIYKNCVDSVALFKGKFCEGIAETTVGESDLPIHCTIGDNCYETSNCDTGYVCAENKCRKSCETTGGSNCSDSEVCWQGYCMPKDCYTLKDEETLCKLEALYQAEALCLMLPCPESDVDDRINRILPVNTTDRPDDPQSDDDE